MNWDSKEAAIKELKRNGFAPHGEDYTIAEVSDGHYQIVDRANSSDGHQQAARKEPTKKAAPSSKKEVAKKEVAKKEAPKKQAEPSSKKGPAPRQMSAWTKQALEMAKSPNGAKRAKLNELRANIGWKSYLARIGKKDGLVMVVTKDDEGLVYALVKR